MSRNIWNERSGKKFLGYNYKMVKLSAVRRMLAKKRATRPRSKIYGKRKYIRKGNGPKPQGFCRVKRKMPMCVVKTDALLGSFSVVDDGPGTLVSLGTPSPSIGLPSGWYDLPFAMTFAINQATNFTEFSALFDEYKINAVNIRVSPNSTIAQSATSQTLPYIEWVYDHDDSVPPNIATFRERMGIRTKFFNATTNSANMYCRPRPVSQVYATPAIGYSTNQKATWLDMSNTTVPHYAIKGVIRHVYSPGINAQSQITLDGQLDLSFKGVQ